MSVAQRVTPWAIGTDPASLPWVDGRPRPTEHPRQAFVAQVMGLPVSVHVRGPRARSKPVALAVEVMFDRLRRDDRTFSTYRPHSEVNRVRRGELRLGDASPGLREVAALCERAARETEGAFSAWLPGPDGSPAFDPTGLVKGWSVEGAFDQLTTALNAFGRHDLLVSAGGDVIVACSRPDTPDWLVGVEDPRDRQSLLTTIPLRRGAVATSGNAARGHHILDPATGSAVTDLLSITVVGPSLTWADVYATAAFVKGRRAAEWIAGLHGHAGFIVDGDGHTHVIAGGG